MVKNPLTDWIDIDSELLNLINNIDRQTQNEHEKAVLAFNKLSELYLLPKYPEDVSDSEFDSSSSMYEVLGKIKFANNNTDDLKSNVLLAAYLIKNKSAPNIDDSLKNYLGKEELSGFGYRGENVDVEMIPIKKGESWFEKGCTYFTKEISSGSL